MRYAPDARRGSLKRKLETGRLTVGSWLSFGYPLLCEMMATAGFEWLVVDMEHTAIDAWDAQQLIQIIDLAGCAPLVRVGANDPLLIKRAMDAGSHGVVVPMVNSAVDARKAVSAIRYAPLGSRGAGLARAQRYGLAFDEYRRWLEEEAVVIVQIEHIDGVENLDEILDVEGVDAFIVGPYDLSCSLGQPGDFEHPDMIDALGTITTAMAEGATGGYHVVHSDEDAVGRCVDRGYRLIAYGDDMIFLAEKLRDEVAGLKQVGWLAEKVGGG